MGLQTHLGPQLLGTVKNNNPALVTSANPIAGGLGASTGTITSGVLASGVPTGTVWPPFLGTGQSNGVRNLGVGDGTQFGAFTVGSTSFPTNQSGVVISNSVLTNSNTGTTATTYAFYPGIYTTGGQFQPMVMPAGSYLSAFVFDIVTGFTIGGTPGTTSQIQLAVYAVGAPGTTYATPQLLMTHTGLGTAVGTGVSAAWATAQRNQVGSGSGLSLPANATGYLVNSGNTDTILMCVISLLLGNGTGPLTLTAGCGYLGVNYTIRNPDGSWYPQTPTSPIANPPVATY